MAAVSKYGTYLRRVIKLVIVNTSKLNMQNRIISLHNYSVNQRLHAASTNNVFSSLVSANFGLSVTSYYFN